MSCRTCNMIRGLLMAEGVSPQAVEAVMPLVAVAESKIKSTVKRKASAYSKRYGRAFRSVAGRYKTKSGRWMKNGFARAQKEAHRIAKRG
jgi:hypothetical protein